MNLSAAIADLLGSAPAGYDILLYIFAFLVLFYLLSSTFALIWSLLKWLGGK